MEKNDVIHLPITCRPPIIQEKILILYIYIFLFKRTI